MRYCQSWLAGRYDPSGKESYPLFRAEVPGNVQKDWWEASEPGDIMYGSSVKKLDITEGWHWIYKTRLDFSRRPGERVFFVAEGIDYIFDILLGGEKIYSHEGMFTKTELDITDRAETGTELCVVIHPHPKTPGPHREARGEANQSCKPPMCYGWDWNPRLLISGIWKPAYIETRDSGFISSCEPFYTLSGDLRSADVRFETVCGSDVCYTVKDMEGNTVYSGYDPEFRLDDIRLWWCSGCGTPYLYTWTAKSESDEKSGTIGFRKIRLVRNTGTMGEPYGFPKSRYAAAVTVELNGVRIFAKGSNWVNPELFTGTVTAERYEELIKAAADCNMNIFRLWGGSGINKDEFYDLCDRYGIMLWQEFMLSCNNYEDTPGYMAVLEQEAGAIIRHLRRHPSIILWCGGNELFNGWSGMDDQSHALRLLNKLCYELDYDRPFFPTSPMPGMAHGGYTFINRENGDDVFAEFIKAHQTAYTEFGVPCIAPLENIQRIIPENELFPIEKTDAWITHHGFGAWGDQRWLCLDDIEHYFGKQPDLPAVIEKSQWLQAVGYKAIFEEARRQWPYCSMAINWCFCEPWITAANNTPISWPLKLKPSYFAIRDSLRPVVASARIGRFDWKPGDSFKTELWMLNDSGETVSDRITASLVIGDETFTLLTWETGDIEPRGNKRGPAAEIVLPSVKAEEMTLRITASSDDRSSEYRLRYYGG